MELHSEHMWAALDLLAEEQGLSASGLAIVAGLDPTAFNRSKRERRNGRPRWPSTETIAKVLLATNVSFSVFARLVEQAHRAKRKTRKKARAPKSHPTAARARRKRQMRAETRAVGRAR